MMKWSFNGGLLEGGQVDLCSHNKARAPSRRLRARLAR